MRFTKDWKFIVVTACAIVTLSGAFVMGKSEQSITSDTAKTIAYAKHLKAQTTCPVSGEAIDKNQYVDYNGKRIYVCSPDHITQVKKNPEQYIKKLANMGQGVENLGVTADTSIKGMEMKNTKMKGNMKTNMIDSGYWTCPMHPQIHKTEIGNCPICGMNLVFKKNENIPKK